MLPALEKAMYSRSFLKVLTIFPFIALTGISLTGCSVRSGALINYGTGDTSIDYILSDSKKEASILFVVDVSGSMDNEHELLVKNILQLAVLFDKKKYFTYNFGFMVAARQINRMSSGLLSVHPKFLERKGHLACIPPSKAEGVQFVKESRLGHFFRFSPSDIKKFSKEELFCFLSKTLNSKALKSQYTSRGKGGGRKAGGGPGGNFGNSIAFSFDSEEYFSPLEVAMDFVDDNKQDSVSKSFFDSKSHLIVVFISDAVGEGYEEALSVSGVKITPGIPEEVISKRYADRFLQKIKKYKELDQVRFYGVVQTIKDSCTTDSTSYEGEPPYHVLSLIKTTGGVALPLCDKDWGAHIDVIANDLDHFLRINEFFLESIPTMSSLEVFYNEMKVSKMVDPSKGGWYYNPRSVSVTVDLNENDILAQESDEESGKRGNKITIKYNPVNLEAYFQDE